MALTIFFLVIDQVELRRSHTAEARHEGRTATAGSNSSSSRPPRPPSQKTPYALSAALIGRSSNSPYSAAGSRRASTPPRQAADPGARVDSNFVYEDWDEEVASRRTGEDPRGGGGGGRAAGGATAQRANSSSGMLSPVAGVYDDVDDKQLRSRGGGSGVCSSSGSRGPPSVVRAWDGGVGGVVGAGSERGGGKAVAMRQQASSAVRADPNWLEEDFDDD